MRLWKGFFLCCLVVNPLSNAEAFDACAASDGISSRCTGLAVEEKNAESFLQVGKSLAMTKVDHIAIPDGSKGVVLASPKAGPAILGQAVAVKNREVTAKATVWSNLAAWMRSNGAHIHDSLMTATTRHGGSDVRGMVTKQAINETKLLFQVPRKLWIEISNFPDSATHMDESVSERACKGLLEGKVRTLAALASETLKGNASFYSPFIRSLPSMKDFRQFHPQMAEASLLADFAALPLIKSVMEYKRKEQAYKECFEAWQNSSSVPIDVAKLSWGDFHLALMQFQTRAYSLDGSPGAMVPGTDMANTVLPSGVNTNYEIPEVSKGQACFQVKATQTIEQGKEVYEGYCSSCDNSWMMLVWGVYLEDNAIQLSADDMNCGAAIGPEGTAVTLKDATEAALDHESKVVIGITPRCRTEVMSSRYQGPLRCSLARLAWEHCAAEWYPFKLDLADLGSRMRVFNGLSAKTAAALVDRSAIGKVESSLMHTRKATPLTWVTT
eukprot:gnl/TRDRNA2_/TRDRNA2_42690_c0_seq1.p1 gnl/TRDRNA2_/TRDRNA2_42690_c0~~gnl/TRDRNA2_/TRDRNA2_42690_c0_seq1.p1  ORF type:complete len:498 (+),score=69.06 gnl/TRDRNA2_/TRDRNA2_42690_c0_seq1:82-1575(+)